MITSTNILVLIKQGGFWINKHNDIRTLLVAIALTVLF